MIKIAGSTDLSSKNSEASELVKELSRIKEQILKSENSIVKCNKLIADRKSTIRLKRQKLKDNLNTAEEMNISTETRKVDNREEIEKCKQAIEKTSQGKSHLELNFQIQSKELARKLNEAKHSLVSAKVEISRLNHKIHADKNIIKILSDTLQKEDSSVGGSKKGTSVDSKVAINSMAVMNRIQVKEETAARRIQQLWSRYKRLNRREPSVLTEENVEEAEGRNIMTPPDVFEQGLCA
eukprot:TRINITY_DN5330_c0_g2_i3.p4 TRINITY_DN5330_c0_g2~~TRINITY_DN5330_c0_g2_i3.p4  ORF type:complete len:238 (-),score=63.34 TRINITY_DN5330_c0_g2_i3:79-792(-)